MKNIIIKKLISLFVLISLLSGFSFSSFAETANMKKLNELVTELEELDKEIENAQQKVNDIQTEVTAAQVAYNLQLEVSKKRIKHIYENNGDSALSLIFESESLAEFNSNIYFMESVTNTDANVLSKLQKAKKRIEKKQKKLEKAIAKLESQKEELSTSSESLKQLVAQEEATAAKKAMSASNSQALNNARDLLNKIDSSYSTGSGTTTGSAVLVAVPDDVVFLAAVLQCEAHQGYENYLAVATVVVNRVNNPNYPSTISGVLTAPNQFSTVPYAVTRVLNSGVNKTALQAAQDAINGKQLTSVKDCYNFRSAKGGHAGINVGGNVFF